MLTDTATLNAKGHVKLELYNDNGVFYTKEKKNLVVQKANEIVANMMADPAKVLRVNQIDKGDTAISANADLLYPFSLTVQHEVKNKFENNWGSSNIVTEFAIEDLKGITSLDKVFVGEAELTVDEDVFLLDAEQGIISFAAAPTETVQIFFHKTNNPYLKVIAGTEKVKVNGEEWTRGKVANTAQKHYVIDYRTGQVFFDSAKTKVEVEYDFHMNYSLGFMALGGKPTPSHPNFMPKEFGNSDRLNTYMQNELPGSRMMIHYPSSVSYGATEIDPSIPTQPVNTVTKTATITIVNDGEGNAVTEYALANTHEGAGKPVYKLRKVENKTTSTDIKEKTTLPTNSWSEVSIQFDAADITIGDEVAVEYELQVNSSHLVYKLSQAPVVKLLSVSHIDSITQERKDYLIVDNGLRPNQGDVWISDSNRGVITFAQGDPVGKDAGKVPPRPETPGQIQVEYMVNAGVVVKFIADFPKGVPAPVIEDAPVKVETVATGQSSISLNYPIAKDETNAFIEPVVKVKDTVSGVVTTLPSTEYTISLDGRTITPNVLSAGDEVTVEYKYEKTTHDIYQVAMFDQKSGGNMFNISGIGPVTKDKNTGMRITWSVTF